MLTYVFGNIEKKLALCIVTELMLLGVIPIDPLKGFYFLTFLSLIFSDSLKNMIYANLLMIISCGDNLSLIFEMSRTWYESYFKFTYSEYVKDSIYDSSEIPTARYCITIRPITVKEPDNVELLRITIDKHLDFEKHIENSC